MLTKTELNLFTILQPELLKRKGEWQEGDAYYCQHYNKTMHWLSYIDQCDECIIPLNNNCAMRIWLPRIVDLDRPERGLLQMFDYSYTINDSQDAGDSRYTVIIRNGMADFSVGATPTEAVLRALAEQWNVVVRG